MTDKDRSRKGSPRRKIEHPDGHVTQQVKAGDIRIHSDVLHDGALVMAILPDPQEEYSGKNDCPTIAWILTIEQAEQLLETFSLALGEIKNRVPPS